MSKWDKLFIRIYALSRDLRFDELRKVLESYKHEPIKKVYVEMVRQVAEGEVENDENTE